jgi:hypothetical protein
MPGELIDFVHFQPKYITDEWPESKDIENVPSPRTIANAGSQQAKQLPESLRKHIFRGIAGPIFAEEYTAFLEMCKQLPSLDTIVASPDTSLVPDNPSTLYAITGGLSRMMNDQNIGAICTYLERIAPEFSVCCMTDATVRNPKICDNRAYAQWAQTNSRLIA